MIQSNLIAKSAVFSIATLLPGLAFGANVTMAPGDTIIVPPSQESTTVACQGSGNVTVLDHYCTCLDAGPRFMKRLNNVYVMSNSAVREIYLGDFPTMEACEESKSSQDACK